MIGIISLVRSFKDSYGVDEVYLFGSVLDNNVPSDLDVIVKVNSSFCLNDVQMEFSKLLNKKRIPYKITIEGYDKIVKKESFYLDIVLTKGEFLYQKEVGRIQKL